MKIRIICLLLCMAQFATAQPAIDTSEKEKKGMHFEKLLDWEQAKSKAKVENKYIFLDCYASWCQPCKAMDKEVYPNEMLGQFMNEKFIILKVQMDKTKYDDGQTKRWYATADKIAFDFTITAFPTFLFFSPDGQPVHKAVGYKNPERFIAMAKDALDPDKQYYSILSKLQTGNIDTSRMKSLARSFSESGKELAEKLAANYLTRIPPKELEQPDNQQLMIEFNKSPQVAKIATDYLISISGKSLLSDNKAALITAFKQVPQVQQIVISYLSNLSNTTLQRTNYLALLTKFRDHAKAKAIANKYINSLSEKEMYTRDNIEFLTEFTQSPKDIGFKILYNHGNKIDSVMKQKDYAQSIVDNSIASEEIAPYWKKTLKEEKIPWERISTNIKKKYSKQYAERIVLRTKVTIYKYDAETYNKHWSEYIDNNIQYIEKYGTDTSNPYLDAVLINNFSFTAIFYHSTNVNQVNTAIKWMEGVIRRNPKDANSIDTYANLLYKSGRKEKGIFWQEKALQIAENNNNNWVIPLMKENLSKMRKGIPSWNID